jgi:hypothetical protein
VKSVVSGLVSIMVLNWNGKCLLEECLLALGKQTYPTLEVIFVDNGSTDGSVDFVVEHFPLIRVVKLYKNYGFAGGNSKGLGFCNGEFIVLLNNDTHVDEKWLENLVIPMIKDSSVGICASKLIVESTGRIDSAGDTLTTWGVGFKRGCGEEQNLYLDEQYIFGACAAAALYRKTLFEDVGFLDEDFFFNDEDTDLNFRAQLAGWKCVFIPSALVSHKVNATIGNLSDLHVYYHVRNLEFLWLKNMPIELMVCYAHLKFFQELGSFLYLCLRHGKWKAYFKGKRDALKLFPRMLKKRHGVQAKRRVTNAYLKGMFLPVWSRELVRQKIRQFVLG